MNQKKINYISFFKENRNRNETNDIYKQSILDSRKIFKKFSNSFVKRPCPICGNKKSIYKKDFDKRYKISECINCASLYVNPCPNLTALKYYYNKCEVNHKLNQVLKKRSLKGGLIVDERLNAVIKLIKELLISKKKIKILDIGCNSGSFLNEIQKKLKIINIEDKVKLIGIDIDKTAIENKVSASLELYCSSAENFIKKNKNKFDIVMFFELIEHLSNPFRFIKSVKTLINHGGYAYFHTPNNKGLDNRALGYNDFRPLAHGIFPPKHLQAFNTQNISHFIIRGGLSIIDIKTPGNFDIDILRRYIKKNNHFAYLLKFKDKNSFAIIQKVIRDLEASSHMSVLARSLY